MSIRDNCSNNAHNSNAGTTGNKSSGTSTTGNKSSGTGNKSSTSSSRQFAVCDGALISESDALVSVTRREVFYGFSVYETIKLFNGAICYVDEHIERFFESASVIGLEHKLNNHYVKDCLCKLVKANKLKKAFLKIQLIGGNPPKEAPIFFAFSADLPSYPQTYYEQGVKVITYAGERTFPRAKTNALLLNYVAAKEAVRREALDALLIDRHGQAIEGTRTNVFGVIGNKLITPHERVLFGVTRKHIIEVASSTGPGSASAAASIEELKGLGLQVEYRGIAVDEIKAGALDELFISSTSMGAVPVRQVDDVVIGRVFPVTAGINQQLQLLYDKASSSHLYPLQ